MKYLFGERKRQAEWKLTTKYIPYRAKHPGLYRNSLRPFCLLVGASTYNLFDGIRDQALAYFKENKIPWHTAALPGMPTNHLCSSQVMCLNMLFPFTWDDDGFKKLLKPFFPGITKVLPMTELGPLIEFEWLNNGQYLVDYANDEKKQLLGNTGIDAVFKVQTSQKGKVLVLCEYKYSESYNSCNASLAANARRFKQYCQLAKKHDLKITSKDVPAIYQEPLAQMIRHKLLAIMLKKEMPDIDHVEYLYLHRDLNTDLFVQKGAKTPIHAGEVFKRIIPDKGFFKPVTIESLFTKFIEDAPVSYLPWVLYMKERYGLGV